VTASAFAPDAADAEPEPEVVADLGSGAWI
jgi:hypothetical protein